MAILTISNTAMFLRKQDHYAIITHRPPALPETAEETVEALPLPAADEE